jgi:hypothetical protein
MRLLGSNRRSRSLPTGLSGDERDALSWVETSSSSRKRPSLLDHRVI